jgi:hypothetical protein
LSRRQLRSAIASLMVVFRAESDRVDGGAAERVESGLPLHARAVTPCDAQASRLSLVSALRVAGKVIEFTLNRATNAVSNVKLQ